MSQATVNFYLPAPPLRQAISTYYVLRIAGSEEVEDIIHLEWPNVRLVLSGRWRVQLPERLAEFSAAAAISGTLERGVVVGGTPGLLVGVGLLPEGWVRLTGQSADGFADRWRPLSDAFGDTANDLLPALRAVTDGDELFATSPRLEFTLNAGPDAPDLRRYVGTTNEVGYWRWRRRRDWCRTLLATQNFSI